MKFDQSIFTNPFAPRTIDFALFGIARWDLMDWFANKRPAHSGDYWKVVAILDSYDTLIPIEVHNKAPGSVWLASPIFPHESGLPDRGQVRIDPLLMDRFAFKAIFKKGQFVDTLHDEWGIEVHSIPNILAPLITMDYHEMAVQRGRAGMVHYDWETFNLNKTS